MNMKNAIRLAIVILGIAAASTSAQTEPWPPDVLVSPQNPGASDLITLTISDTWSTDCVPQGIVSTQIQGNSIYVAVGFVYYFVCNPGPKFWQQQCSIAPLAAGCYDVYVGHGIERDGNLELMKPFTKAATFCVSATGGGTGGSFCFPRPAYDSGWVDMPGTGPSPYTTTLTHNLGGNVDDYILDLQRRDSGLDGNDVRNLGIGDTFYYSHLTTTSITLTGPISPKSATVSLRVRIWDSNCVGSCQADFAPYEPSDQGLSPSTIHAGQVFNLTFGVVNNGTEAIAPGWRIRYFASLDTNIQQADGDYLLYDTTADFGIEPGQHLTLLEAFILPSTVPAGQYYIGWIFDPLNAICESNENNNTGCLCTTGARLTVGGPTCQPEVTDVKIWRGQLVGGSFQKLDQVDKVALGDLFQIVVEVTNKGTTTVNVSNLYGWTLSGQGNAQVVGNLCVGVFPISLDPGESATLDAFCPGTQAFQATQAGWATMDITVGTCHQTFGFEVQ
jgi:hypothetical protein